MFKNGKVVFHFMQILWRRAGQEKIRTKEKIGITRIMITGLNLLVFIEEQQIPEAFNKLKEYIFTKSKEFGYKNFLNYFESNRIKGNIPISTRNFYVECVKNFTQITVWKVFIISYLED